MKLRQKLKLTRRRGGIFLAVVLAVAFGVFWLFFRVPEPLLDGVGLGQYLAKPIWGGRDARAIFEGIPKMGQEPVPYLRQKMERNTLLELIIGWRPDLPVRVQAFIPTGGQYNVRRMRAAALLTFAGTNAAKALPTALRILEADESLIVRQNCLSIVANCAPGTDYEDRAVRALLKAVEEPELRSSALFCLGGFTNQWELIVPKLVEGLYQSHSTRLACIKALEKIGAPAVPTLRKAAATEGVHVRPAELVLEKLGVDLEAPKPDE